MRKIMVGYNFDMQMKDVRYNENWLGIDKYAVQTKSRNLQLPIIGKYNPFHSIMFLYNHLFMLIVVVIKSSITKEGASVFIGESDELLL